MITKSVQQVGEQLLSPDTMSKVEFDLHRLKVRLKTRLKYRGRKNIAPEVHRLHLGCGNRRVQGWLNVDLFGSDVNLDLAAGYLPWKDDAFESVVGQHFVTCLKIEEELLPLMGEVQRITRPGGDVWISAVDIEKVCKAYLDDQMQSIVEGRKERFPEWELGEMPTVHMMNDLFYREGENKNLFDLDLLAWVLTESGFEDVREVSESDLLERFPSFPARGDEEQTIYVRALAAG